MTRSTLILTLALLTVAGLGVATLATLRRQQAESRAAEWKRMSRSASAGKPAAPPIEDARVPHGNSRLPGAALPAPARNAAEAKPAARPDIGEIFAAHPELQSAYREAVSGRLRQTYGRLFGRLGLSRAQGEHALALLARDAEHEFDLAMTAQTLQLPKEDAALQQFRRNEKADTEARLQALLGAQGMQMWRDYNRALGMRATADDVASLTLATDTPMTGVQVDQLTRVLAEASASYRAGEMPEWSTMDWPEVLSQARTFLAPSQLAALEAKIQQAKAVSLLSQFYATHESP